MGLAPRTGPGDLEQAMEPESRGRLAGLGLFAGLLALYGVTMPHTVTLEDSGLFSLAAHTAGIGHPPGYPLHAILGWLFTRFPAASPAVPVHALSAVAGALACVVAWRVGMRLGVRPLPAWLAAFGLGVSLRFWSQAIVAEVYTLVVLLFVATLWAVLAHGDARRPARTALLAGHLAGLGVSLHWPLFGLALPGLAIVGAHDRARWAKTWPWAASGAVLGLWPWAWMVLRSRQAPLVDHYGPIESAGALWFVVSRRGFAGLVTDPWPVVTWGERLGFGAAVAWDGLAQFGFAGTIVALGGAWAARRRLGALRAVGLLAVFLAPLIVLVPMAWGTVGFLWQAVFAPFPLLAWTVLALWLGFGIEALEARIRGATAAVAVGIGLLALWHGVRNDRHDDTFARDYATAVLDLLEPDAVLFVHGDADVGPVGYRRLLEGYRPDVRLLHDGGLVFSDRLFPAGGSAERKREALARFVATSERPVYATADLGTGQIATRLGLVDRLGPAPSAARVRVDPRAASYWAELARSRPRDPWERVVRKDLLHAAGAVLGTVVLLGGDTGHASLLAEVQADWHGAKGVLEACAPTGDAAALLAVADAMGDDPVALPADVARVAYLRGVLLLRLGRVDEAVAALVDSASVVRAPGTLRLLDEARRARSDR